MESSDNCYIMSTDTITDGKRELEEVVARLMKGERDPEAARRACERMDQTREEIRERIGMVEVAVDLVRDARDR